MYKGCIEIVMSTECELYLYMDLQEITENTLKPGLLADLPLTSPKNTTQFLRQP